MDKANQLTTWKCPDSPINQMKIKKLDYIYIFFFPIKLKIIKYS